MNQLGSAGKRNGRARQQRLYDLLRRAILNGVLVEGWTLPGMAALLHSL
jgi:DNA-binding GntR family transcriptional regulator